MNMLSVKQLTIRRKEGDPLIGPLNFDIAAGEVMTLMGASGV